MRANELLQALHNGQFDERLRTVYGGQPLAVVHGRIESVISGFCGSFDKDRTRDLMIFSAPGRTELGGNHTDHQGGCGLAGSVDLDTLACVAQNDGTVIRVLSRGHDAVEVDVRDKAIREEEKSRSQALVRGVAARIGELGYEVGGFDAYTAARDCPAARRSRC